jgi:PAS domain S-box-containing protein
VRFIGAAIVALGFTVLAGWALKLPVLVQILPGYVAMVANTALCFVLCGFAMLSRSAVSQRIFAGAAVVLSVLVWSQDLFAVDLRVDNALFDNWLQDPNPFPGRMAPQTAIGFILCGCVVLLLSGELRSWSLVVAQVLILCVGATGIVSLIGYSLRLELLYDWYRYTRMAVHTAAAFTLLAIALWIAWYRRNAVSRNYDEHEDRRFNAIGAALIVLVAMAAGTAGFALLARHTEVIARNALSLQLESRRQSLATLIANQEQYTQLVVRLPRLQRVPSTLDDDARLMPLDSWSQSILGDQLSSLIILSNTGERLGSAGDPWERPELTIPLGPHTFLLWNKTIRIRHQAPIINTRTSETIGSIVTEMEAPLIAQLVEQMSIMGTTADMRICSPTSATRMQCLPTRLEPRIAPQASRFLDSVELPMSRAFRGASGTDIFVNYRHKRSIGAYGPLGTTGLGVVVQQDTEDTYAPIRAPFQTLLLYLAVLVGGTILLLRWQVAPLVRKAVSAQAEAKANAARVAAIMNSVPDGIITIDMEGRIVSANPAVTQLFGYSSDELVGQNVQMLLPSAMRDRHDQGLSEHRESGRRNLIGKGTVEIPAMRNDRREFTMQLALTEMQLFDERYVVGIMRDVTERIVAERKLNNTHALLQTTLDNVIDAIVTTKTDGTIQSWNLAAERVFGVKAADAINRDLQEWVASSGRSLLDVTMSDATEAAGFIAGRRELDCVHSSGRVFPIDIGITVMSIDNERLLVHVIRDISERREVERVKTEIVSAVSHELRTPLTSIAGSLGMMVNGAVGTLPPNAQRLAEIANRNTQRLCRLINDILDLEKASHGELEFNIRLHSLNSAVEQVVEANQAYAASFEVGIELEVLSEDVLVNIDLDRFGQVLTNVISNAIKFSPRGATVRVRPHVIHSAVCVAVIDCGPGIPDAFRSKMYQRFAQADSSDARAKGGTGLGLSIAKTLIEKMHGEISYECSPRGTTFYVSLPIEAERAVRRQIPAA